MYRVFFLIILVIFSCQRRREERYRTNVSGKVIDKETYEGIPGAPVYIMRVNSNNSNDISFPDQQTTDANGVFNSSFIAETGNVYYAYSIYGNYLINGFVYLAERQDNQVNILLSKPGYLAVHIKNQSPNDSTDLFSLIDSDYYNRNIQFNGTIVDTTIIITHYGNQANRLKWEVFKNDTTISFDTTLNFISLDTIPFDLFY